MVEGTIHLTGLRPFGYAGVEILQAFTLIQASERSSNKGRARTHISQNRLRRLKIIGGWHREKQAMLAQMANMRARVMEVKPPLDGS